MERITTVAVEVSTRLALRNLGHKGESYNDVILRLIANCTKDVGVMAGPNDINSADPAERRTD